MKYKVIVVVCFLFFVFSSEKAIFANNLKWYKSEGIPSGTSILKISKSNNSKVYANITEGFNSGLYSSDNGGENFKISYPIFQGSVNSISISAINPNVVWIGTYSHGVYKSIDGGKSWKQAGLQDVKIRSISVDPFDDNTIYAGAGENDNDGGILKTTDSGLTWSLMGVSTFGRRNTLNIYSDRLVKNRLFASSGIDLFKSLNCGITWTYLNLRNAWLPATIVDITSSNVIYASVYNDGLYKSVNDGINWKIITDSIGKGIYFQISQDDTSYLYSTKASEGGGVWRSQNGGESWENIADPGWGDRKTWGLDVSHGRILVSVEGLGIYAANTDGSSIFPNPVVFVPGMTASWSYKGLVENQTTTYQDWKLFPVITDYYYGPVLETFEKAGLVRDQSLFTFGYDWTKSISISAESLNQFLEKEVLPKNNGMKANLIGHSMGGLVIRYCFEKIAGCSERINKIVTAGTPHQGAVDAYSLWEGGKIEEKSVVKKTGFELLTWFRRDPNLPTIKDIVQHDSPGIRDILPNFDYLEGKPYSLMSPMGQNLTLDGIKLPSQKFLEATTVLWGDALPTSRFIKATIPDRWEQLVGLWPDGKPVSIVKDKGDSTVLDFSAKLSGAGETNFSGEHSEYFRNAGILSKILEIFELKVQPEIPSKNPVEKFLMFFLQSPARLTVKDMSGSEAGVIDESRKAVFLADPEIGTYQVEVVGEGSGEYDLNALYVQGENQTQFQSIHSIITPNQKKRYIFEVEGNFGSAFVDNPNDYFESFKNNLEKSGHRKSGQIVKNVEKLLSSLKTQTNKQAIIKGVMKNYLDLMTLFRQEKNSNSRFFLLKSCEDLFNLSRELDREYDAKINLNQASEQIKAAEFTTGKLKSKKQISTLESLNLNSAMDLLARAMEFEKQSLSYVSYLSSMASYYLTR